MKKVTVTEKFKDGVLIERITVTEECETAKCFSEYTSDSGMTVDCSDYAETGVTTAR